MNPGEHKTTADARPPGSPLYVLMLDLRQVRIRIAVVHQRIQTPPLPDTLLALFSPKYLLLRHHIVERSVLMIQLDRTCYADALFSHSLKFTLPLALQRPMQEIIPLHPYLSMMVLLETG